MKEGWQGVVQAARELASTLPRETLAQVSERLAQCKPDGTATTDSEIIGAIANAAGREAVANLLRAWRRDAPDLPPVAVAMALAAAAEVDDAWRQHQRVEVVWTGPPSRGPVLRRTDQALLELIRGAKRQLTLVSFAAYKVPDLAQALAEAAGRGVAVRLIMETPEDSDGAVTFKGFDALTGPLATTCERLIWPRTLRPVDDRGRPGALHVKCGLADRDVVLVSSANFTASAMGINMELGLLIRAGDVPAKIADIFDQLVAYRRLQPFKQ